MCDNDCSQPNDCFALCSALLTSFVSHKKHENKEGAPGPFPLLPSSALRETYREKKSPTTKESDAQKSERKKFEKGSAF